MMRRAVGLVSISVVHWSVRLLLGHFRVWSHGIAELSAREPEYGIAVTRHPFDIANFSTQR